jgi:hypothetical protein
VSDVSRWVVVDPVQERLAAMKTNSQDYQGYEVFFAGSANSRGARVVDESRAFHETALLKKGSQELLLRRGQRFRKSAKGAHCIVLGFAVFPSKVPCSTTIACYLLAECSS